MISETVVTPAPEDENTGKIPTASGKAVLLALAVLLLTLLALEGVTRWVVTLGQPPLSHSEYFDLKYHLAQKPPTKKDGSIIVLGDSQMYNGLYADLLEKRLTRLDLDMNVLNLANPESSSDMSMYLLDQAISSGHQPKLVLINITPHQFFNVQSNQQSMSKLMASYLGRCVVAPPDGLLEAAECALSKYSYLVRYRGYLKAQLRQGADIMLSPEAVIAADKTRVRLANSPQGWMPLFRFLENETKRTSTPVYGSLNGFDWKRHAIANLHAYCESKKIPLVFVWLPSRDRAIYDNNHFPPDNILRKEYESLSHLPGVYFLNLHEANPNPIYFQDESHLNAVGAAYFTEQVFQALKRPPYLQFLQ